MNFTQRMAFAAQRVYGWLLTFYPLKFRSNYGPLMTQVNRDLTRDAMAQSGFLSLISLWLETIKDLVSSIWKEQFDAWRRDMPPKTRIAFLIGSIFLGISALFVIVNVLQYEIGINLAWNPFDIVLERTKDTPLRLVFDAVILFGPAVAVGLFILPHVEIRLRPGEDELAAIVIHKVEGLSLLLIGLSVLVLGIIGLYLVGENLACLIGQQVSC